MAKADEGVKHDGGKTPWDLAQWHALSEYVRVLEFGARKYTRQLQTIGQVCEQLARLCTCSTDDQQSATLIEGMPPKDCASSATSRSTHERSGLAATETGSSMQEGSVGSVMTDTSKLRTQDTPNGNGGTSSDGRETTATGFESTSSSGNATTLSQSELVAARRCSAGLGLRGKMSCSCESCSAGDAQSAVVSQVERSTSITVTSPARHEGFSVESATRDLDYSMTTRRFLSEHLPTCAVHRALAWRGDVLVIPGEDNWRKVPELRRRYYAAAMRHLVAWWGGERLDPESGLHHLAHALCCVAFVLETELEGENK